MKRIKIAILISFGFIVLVVSLSLWAHYRAKKPAEEVPLPKIAFEGADSRIEKIRFVEEKQGKKTWELEAKAIQQYQGQNVMILEDVKLTFFTRDGKTVTVTGDRGKVYQDTKNTELEGNIVVNSSEGYRVKTNSMTYNHQERRIRTPDLVELDGEQLWMKGRGVLVDLEAQTVKVLHEVKTRWKAERKG
jgi:lipopolysaccharide export system protein LptC